MMMPRRGTAAVGLLGVTALVAAAAVWASTPQSVPAPADDPAPAAVVTVASLTPAAPEGTLNPRAESASADSTAEAALGEQTRLFVSCYLAPAVPRWRDCVRGYLSAGLAAAFDTVDPGRVPTATVSTVSIEVDDFAAQAVAQTTAGPMTVIWTWSGDRWEVTAFVPPTAR